MKIEGKLIFMKEQDEIISIIAESLQPDNVAEMETIIDDEKATVIFRGSKVSTILSSIDDYLMNAIIVERLSCGLKEIGFI